MSWAEQNSTTALREARKARKTAKAELWVVGKKLTGIRKTRRALKEEWRRARKQRYENKAELQRLDGQLQERRWEEDATIRHIRIQNEQINPIRGLQGRRDDLAQAESRLANLNVHLDQLQNKIAGLEILRRQARDRRTKLDARLQELAGKIAEKNKERRSTQNEIERKKQYLDEVLRPAVAKAVWEVRVEEVRTPLKNLKDRIKEQGYLLQVFGGAGLVYAYTLVAGYVHELWLYCSNGLRVADYTVLSDFVLVEPVLRGVLLTPVVVLLMRWLLAIPWASELTARSLCLLVGRPVWRRFVIGLGMVVLSLIGPGAAGYWTHYLSDLISIWLVLLGVLLTSVIIILARRLLVGRPVIGLGMVGLSLIGPGAAGYWTYNGVFSIPGNNEDTVTVLTDPPLGEAGDLVLVGSNSTYMFFKSSSRAGGDPPSVKAIPLTRIVCVGKDCKAEAVESSKGTVSLNYEIPEGNGAASELIDTVRDATKAVQSIARWRNPDGAPTRFEKAVVEELGEIGVKIEALTPRSPAGYSDYVAERLLPQFIGERMQCEKRTEPVLSDLIRFVNDEPYPLCPACSADASSAAGSVDGNAKQEALNKFYREKIRPKVWGIVAEFSKKFPTRWMVFGFASPDGEEGKNDLLSKNRARVVIDEMCRLRENGTSEPAIDCGEKTRYADTQVLYFGEWHPINGISNSRSAVIAACVRKTNESSPKTPPRRSVEVGSNNGEERRPARQTGDVPAAAR